MVAKNFSHFGPNKKQEIVRLVYEISKRDNLGPANLIRGAQRQDFSKIKQYLVRRRFPYAYAHREISRIYLPSIELAAKDAFNPLQHKFCPKKIIVEKAVKGSYLAKRFKNAFPKADFYQITTLKDYLEQQKKYGIRDYNARRDIIFIVEQKDNFFKKCPCTKGAAGCGLYIFNLGFGCIFDCTYCYLQEYTNTPGIILPANIENFFNKFSAYKHKGLRLGTGEFSDSLALDHITEYSFAIIDFLRKEHCLTFEFKTKSNNIANLLKAKHRGNIVVSWSLNPQRLIRENEFFTASLSQRIGAMLKCVKAGYKIGWHFDPVFYFAGWQKEYAQVIENLFAYVKPRSLAWISIGTFRFKPELKKIIEARFPQNKILDEELLVGYDNKLRYPLKLRYAMYKSLSKTMEKHAARRLPIYLCMEEKAVI